MKSLNEYIETDFNTQRSQWEKQLKLELKIEDVGSKTSKKLLEGSSWPTLSLSTPTEQQLPVAQSWKKAAQTYILKPDPLVIAEDLAGGVRSFFFYQADLTFPKHDDLELVQLGTQIKYNALDVVSGQQVEHLGGSNVQELALLTKKLIQNLSDNEQTPIAVFVNANFFQNIAKIRAAKLLALKVFQESQIETKLHVIALTSYREWTLFERYSNMLRNNVAVASAYMGGADTVQSSGYQTIFEIETGVSEVEHADRSLRMARNTSHILALESMLGVVEDPAYGSYHLESLTHHYAAEAWGLMQKLLPLSAEEEQSFLMRETQAVRDQQLHLVKTRRHVLAGINDYPDVKEKINVKASEKFFRLARPFESLRIKMAALARQPKVHVSLYGDYAALNARINFVKNYFELLGLEVNDPSHQAHDRESFLKDVSEQKEDILVLCSTDEGYQDLLADIQNLKHPEKFIAGKVALQGVTAIHAGQDVYSILESLVTRWSNK